MRFGSSNIDSWVSCPGSASLAATVPDDKPTAFMAAGTEAHKKLELSLRGEINPYKDGVPAGVVEAFEYVTSLLMDMEGASPPLIEEPQTLGDDIKCTPDVIIRSPDHLAVVEYKNGAGILVPETSMQMMLGAACILEADKDYQPATISCHVVQPNHWSSNGGARSVTYTYGDLKAFIKRVKTAITKAKKSDPPFKVGDHCRTCKARIGCEALRGPKIIADGGTLTLPPISAVVDPEWIGRTLEALDQLEIWAKAFRDKAKSIALSGTRIPGMKLVASRGVRKFTDHQATRAWFENRFDYDLDDFMPRALISVAKAEKLVKSREGVEVVAQMLHLADRSEAGFRLVPESSPEAEVIPAELLAADFADSYTLNQEKL